MANKQFLLKHYREELWAASLDRGRFGSGLKEGVTLLPVVLPRLVLPPRGQWCSQGAGVVAAPCGGGVWPGNQDQDQD